MSETITQSEFNERMDKSIIYQDLLGYDHVLRIGISQAQLLLKYNVQLEFNFDV